MKLHHLLFALSFGTTAALSAQTTDTPAEGPRGPHRGAPHGPGGHFRHFQGGPGGLSVVRALDSDQNRELSAAELANAPGSLRTLDTNADGVVARDELRIMPHPVGRKGPPGGQRDRPAAIRERPADAPEPPAHLRPRPADGAADQPGPRHLRKHREPGRMVDPVMLALDADRDGALSESEVANATTSLNALDLNKDGTLTFDELRPLPPEEDC